MCVCVCIRKLMVNEKLLSSLLLVKFIASTDVGLRLSRCVDIKKVQCKLLYILAFLSNWRPQLPSKCPSVSRVQIAELRLAICWIRRVDRDALFYQRKR